MDMEERKAKGLLWTDTEEAMAAQKKARGLCYDFNHIHPSESDRRKLRDRSRERGPERCSAQHSGSGKSLQGDPGDHGQGPGVLL